MGVTNFSALALASYIVPNDAEFTIGAESASITVSVQLTDGDGTALATTAGVFVYLSANDDGSTVIGTAPDGGVAIATDGLAIPLVAGKAWQVVSEDDGTFALAITESGAATYYLVVVLPTGKLAVSAVITFNA